MLNPYRKLVNNLISFVEGELYAIKEEKINQIVEDIRLWNKKSSFADDKKENTLSQLHCFDFKK